MEIKFEAIPKRSKGNYGWLIVDGKKWTCVRKNRDGSLSIYLFSGEDWLMREGEQKKGTVVVTLPHPFKG